MLTHLKFETKHVTKYKDKLKQSSIYECVACERLCIRSQTFCHMKKKAQRLTKYVLMRSQPPL
jgi:hypothetical protein